MAAKLALAKVRNTPSQPWRSWRANGEPIISHFKKVVKERGKEVISWRSLVESTTSRSTNQ